MTLRPIRAALLPWAAPGLALSQGPDTPSIRPFFEDYLPRGLVLAGPRGLLWWQWLALPLAVVLSAVLGVLLGFATRAVLARLTGRVRTEWAERSLLRLGGPLSALWAVALFTALEPWLVLGGAADAVLERVLRAVAYLVFFWAGFRLVDVAFLAFGAAPFARGNAGLRGLLPLGRKVSKVLLLGLGAVAVLNELGFQVASLLTGLGIGGVALALAAQKTVENLFGSVAIGVDQPFRVGDFVKVEDFVGTVESIGMRSTRFRTLDRTLITIPNGKLADSRTETFAARDRIRLYTNLALAYHTRAPQMRAVLSGIEQALRAHPLIAPDAPAVRFTEFREFALNVEVMAWFGTSDWGEFTKVRQELFLRFMEIVEEAGAEFAFPVRRVELTDGARGKLEGPGVSARAPRSGGADRDRTDDL